MDELVQEKKDKEEEIPVTMIHVVTTAIPSTLVESLAPRVPMATTLPVTSLTTSTTTAQHSNEASKLVKAMQDMSIQSNEIKRLKEQLKILEYEKKVAKLMHKN